MASLSSSCAGAWQLYLFSITHFVGLLVLFMDMCQVMIGGEECNSTESAAAYMAMMTLLLTGVLFGTLTYVNQGDASKLKRLAKIAAHATVALFAAIIMTGSTTHGGYERGWMHLADMVYFFLLFILLTAANADGSIPMTSHKSVTAGMGLNSKTLLLLIVLILTIKIFAMTDFIRWEFVFAQPDQVTDLTRVFWNLAVVATFELLLGFYYAIAYGDAETDHEPTVIVLVVMSVVVALAGIPQYGHLNPARLLPAMISILVIIALGVMTIVQGRRSGAGYESVPNAASVDV